MSTQYQYRTTHNFPLKLIIPLFTNLPKSLTAYPKMFSIVTLEIDKYIF